ncbi:glycoside hydrolase family 76 protein [Marasmius fiardii PR-910]|nr:glycoside hydrolase family 76 protein [Marasmius fiardii PR-910]
MKFLASTSLFLSLASYSHATCQKYIDAAKTAAKNLQSTYFKGGTYGDQAVWISAVDAFYLLQLDAASGSSEYGQVINTVFRGQEDYLDNGKSYDDVQWVATAYLMAGNQERAKHFYDIASEALETSYCGGGLFWSGARDYKNAITNELYMVTSGYLYEVTKDQKYLDNLKNIWKWLKESNMRGTNGLFNDGLTKDGKCDNNGQTTWTYNQGVVLAGLGYLSKYAQDESAATDAFSIMDALMAQLTTNGALRELCETADDNRCNADQASFKGITTYYMSWFLRVSGKDDDGKYANFVKSQADKVLANAQDGEGVFNNYWPAKGAKAAVKNASTQGAALGALVGAGQLDC